MKKMWVVIGPDGEARENRRVDPRPLFFARKRDAQTFAQEKGGCVAPIYTELCCNRLVVK